jgi:Na+/H+ antiporter NhaD/arsenite permease-like protein
MDAAGGLGLVAFAASRGGGAALGQALPPWSAAPFVGLLLSIAFLPLVAPRFWHRHYPAVALGWGLLLAVPFAGRYGGSAVRQLAHTALFDYVPFVLLLGTLFIIGGGIHLRGAPRGTPGANTAALAAGTLLGSLMGTTGASMILIRPLLQANAARRHRAHTVVFFIFLVANAGGLLTPLGPPLFLGLLHGVPFFWTLRLFPELLLAAGLLLASYLALDLALWRREPEAVRRRLRSTAAGDGGDAQPAAAWAWRGMGVDGAHNVAFLLGTLAAVIVPSAWPGPTIELLGLRVPLGNLAGDALLLLMAAASWTTTAPRVRAANGFSWQPIREVAVLFAGVFATLIPIIDMLQAGQLGAFAGVVSEMRTPRQFFWATGGLSALLDNAPTYLTFLSLALGRLHPGAPEPQAVAALIAGHPELLRAISSGAVLLGAPTYLGNAPNLMIRAIAEDLGVEMPSFFGYVFRYALPFLAPVLALTAWIFY